MALENQEVDRLFQMAQSILTKRFKHNKSELGRHVSLSQPTVNRTLRDDSSQKDHTRKRHLITILRDLRESGYTVEEDNRQYLVQDRTEVHREEREGTKTIPRLEVQVSAGDGTYITQTDEVGTYSLDQEDAPTGSNGLFSVQIKGDSMAPEFLPGSWVVCEPIDAALPQFDAVYLFRHEDLIQIKRLQRRRPDQIHVISSNESYPPYVIRLDDATDFELLARVVRSLKHY